MRVEARRILDCDDPLVGGLVCERRTGDEVADRVDARTRRSQRAVHPHEPLLVELDAGLGEAEPLDVRAPAGGDDEIVDLRRLLSV